MADPIPTPGPDAAPKHAVVGPFLRDPETLDVVGTCACGHTEASNDRATVFDAMVTHISDNADWSDLSALFEPR